MNKYDSTSSLWNRLTEEQEKELQLSYEEGFDPANLISHAGMEKKYSKYLNPPETRKFGITLVPGKRMLILTN